MAFIPLVHETPRRLRLRTDDGGTFIECCVTPCAAGVLCRARPPAPTESTDRLLVGEVKGV